MTTTIYLIRHGQTASNATGFYMGREDVELNEVGLAQAEKLAARLASYPLNSIYASPLKRAFNTAEIVARPHSISVKPMPNLMEMNYGDWQGLHRNEIKQRYPELWRKSVDFEPDMCYPNGESYREVMERSLAAFNEITEKEKDKLTAVVSHQGFLRVMVMHILGATYKMCPKIEFGNTSLSVVKITDGRPRLVTLNDMSHLEQMKQTGR